MVASNTLELLYYKVIGRQRGRGFGVLAQVIRRTAISFLRKLIVPVAKSEAWVLIFWNLQCQI